jgi:Ca-activated chloride channel family protein
MELVGSSPTRTLAPYFLLPNADPTVDRFPLLATAVDVTVSGVIADVRVKQTYKNAGQRALEAVYVFPASTRAAVYGLKMTIGERTIVAQIQERQKAQQDYQQAKREGKSAALLEQQRPNVFQMSVANLMPGEVITVELSYTELLVPVDTVYEFVFPTVVGPRYVGYAQTDGDDSSTANPTLPAGKPPTYDFDLQVRLDAGMPLHDVASPSHRVKVAADGPTRASVELDASERQGGNRDFILRYRLAGDCIASGLVLARGVQGGSFLLMVQPPRQIEPAKLPPREYIFIMDVSGSMRGFPLETSKRLLVDLVSGLRPFDTFNIVTFAGASTTLAERSLQATPLNLQVAQAFMERQRGGGGTELLAALKRALNLPHVGSASRTVVLATDGLVKVEAEAMRVVQQNLGNANLFAFGIGNSVNRFLIEALARAGSGEPTIVARPDEAPARAEQFRRTIASPVLTGIKVDWEGFQVSEVEPEAIPDTFADRPVVVSGKWSGEAKGRIVVRGSTGDQPFAQSFDVAGLTISDRDRGLRNLWARSRIDALADLEALHDPIDHRPAITELGLQNSLLTQYTAFVAIDSQIRNAGGDSTTIRQPLPMPEGVSNQAVGGYAAQPMSRSMSTTDGSSSALDGVRKDIQYERYIPEEERGGRPGFMHGNDELELGIGTAVNLTSDEVGEPVRVPLALAYGVSRELSLGVHSREGLCVTGDDHGCARVFNQLGADVLIALARRWDSGVALRFGFSFGSFAPIWPRLAVGLPMQGVLAEDRLLLRFEPGIEWGLSHTEVNSAVLVLPVRLQLLLRRTISLYAESGVQAAWSRTDTRYVFPAGLGLQLTAAKWLDVALELTVAAKAGSEMPETARRIFYDSAATITPAIYDRSLLLNFRLHGIAGKIYKTLADEEDQGPVDGRPSRSAPWPSRCTPTAMPCTGSASPSCRRSASLATPRPSMWITCVHTRESCSHESSSPSRAVGEAGDFRLHLLARRTFLRRLPGEGEGARRMSQGPTGELR